MYDELISSLREEAEWAEGNEWETPIMLSDHLNQAADAIEELSRKIESLESMREIAPETEYAIDKHADNIISHMEELIRGLENKPRWIPVTEALPDDDTHVLGWDGKRVRFVYVVTDLVFDAFAEKEGITHWMPLPSTEGLNET